MGSSRLPGKVLADVGGIPMLERVVRRARRANKVDAVMVATSDTPSDDDLATFCLAHEIPVHRGSEFDVLDRFHGAAHLVPDADLILRITADCPFIDPDVIDDVVARQQATGADFVANRLPPPYRRTYPVGLDVELVTRAALHEAWVNAELPHEREHVMPYLYDQPGRFEVSIVDLEEDLSEHRWTVDVASDLEVARRIVGAVGAEPFAWTDVLKAVRADPSLEEPNRGTLQKDLRVVDSRWTDPIA